MSSQKTEGDKRKELNELYKDRAVVERFDPTVLTTGKQKEESRMTNEAKRLRIRNYLDTVDIAEGKRLKLLRDLDENPFSARFQKFLQRYKKETAHLQNSASSANDNQ